MKKTLLTLVAVIVIAAGWYVIYTHPKYIKESLSGVEYRSGKPNEVVKQVTIQVNGTLQRSMRGVFTFHGIIQLEGNNQPNPDNNKPLTIHFDGPGRMGWMTYGYWKKDGTPVTYGYAAIFSNADLSQVVILEDQSGWTTTDSLTIAAPASNRNQAVSITNSLMKGWLNGTVVK